MGWGAWSILKGRIEAIALDACRFAVYYSFPGRVEEGQGKACMYIDDRGSSEQRQALEQIGRGNAGGGIVEFLTASNTSER